MKKNCENLVFDDLDSYIWPHNWRAKFRELSSRSEEFSLFAVLGHATEHDGSIEGRQRDRWPRVPRDVRVKQCPVVCIVLHARSNANFLLNYKLVTEEKSWDSIESADLKMIDRLPAPVSLSKDDVSDMNVL